MLPPIVVTRWKIRGAGANGYVLLRCPENETAQQIGGTFPSVEAARKRMEQYINAENRFGMGLPLQ